jgi:hypothetical protein
MQLVTLKGAVIFGEGERKMENGKEGEKGKSTQISFFPVFFHCYDLVRTCPSVESRVQQGREVICVRVTLGPGPLPLAGDLLEILLKNNKHTPLAIYYPPLSHYLGRARGMIEDFPAQ